jgi:hypothetical protein
MSQWTSRRILTAVGLVLIALSPTSVIIGLKLLSRRDPMSASMTGVRESDDWIGGCTLIVSFITFMAGVFVLSVLPKGVPADPSPTPRLALRERFACYVKAAKRSIWARRLVSANRDARIQEIKNALNAPNETVTKILLSMVPEEQDPSIRALALQYLSGTGDRKAIPLLHDGLLDDSEEVRVAAANGLSRLGDDRFAGYGKTRDIWLVASTGLPAAWRRLQNCLTDRIEKRRTFATNEEVYTAYDYLTYIRNLVKTGRPEAMPIILEFYFFVSRVRLEDAYGITEGAALRGVVDLAGHLELTRSEIPEDWERIPVHVAYESRRDDGLRAVNIDCDITLVIPKSMHERLIARIGNVFSFPQFKPGS